MFSRILTTLSVIAISISLAACNPQPVTLKTLMLNPVASSWSAQHDYWHNGACDIPVGGGYTSGLGHEIINPGELPSGQTDIYHQGADPIPCNESMQWIYRGNVQFNLSQFDTIVSADLQFGVSRSTLNTQPQFPPQCVATVLGLATAPISGDNGPYYWNYDDSTSTTMPGPTAPNACQTLVNPLFDIGVSQQVRDWLVPAGTPAAGQGTGLPNYGFIIAGPNLGSPGQVSDNNSQVTFYNGFQLVVLYNPAENPRAPQ